MELYNDNCFNILPNIQDKYVDLFVLDLPYANFKFGKCTACKWDLPIDLDKMWKHIKRIMKPNAVIVFFCNTKFGYALIDSNHKWFKYDLIYKKGNKKVGFLSANRQPLRQHENIYIFNDKPITHSKNEDQEYSTYNPQKTEGKPFKVKGGKSKKVDGSLSRGHEVISKEYENKGDRHPTSILPEGLESTILDFAPPSKTIHRTQKPVKLLEWLIKTYSNENDIIMDFCMGSGTAGVACKNTNRKFIGIEMDKEIYDLAYKRINDN
tara:strand:- start:3519 stop:4316 length:798 start_codon:yes stop_codon:yes gene_type:complete